MLDNRITLYRANGSWMAKHDGPQAADVLALFGTDTIPTAYLDTMPPADVAEQVRDLNPGCAVDVLIALSGYRIDQATAELARDPIRVRVHLRPKPDRRQAIGRLQDRQ